MMATTLQAANIVMALLGEDVVTTADLAADSAERVRKYNALADYTRDEVLRAYPWNFATEEVALVLSGDSPVIEDWSYIYDLPADCLKVQQTEGMTDFRILGSTLYSNYGTLNIIYTKQVTDTTVWDPCFVNAYTAKMMFKLAYGLQNSNTLQTNAKAYYDEAIKEAKGVDSQENRDVPLFYDELTDARMGTFSRNTGYEGSVTT